MVLYDGWEISLLCKSQRDDKSWSVSCFWRFVLWNFQRTSLNVLITKKNWKVKLSRNFFAYSFLPKMEKVELSENFFENLITKTILFPFTLYLRYISLTFELKFIQQNHLFFLILRPKDLCILEISQEFALF